jgi:8-oxo-(d)GTP phosphatase
VLAAGALCWRPAAGGGLELLMVRSARWDDWSWPKGKLEPGESPPVGAVREVAEETGVRVELGLPLPSVSYVLPDGRDKTVSYWVGRVRAVGSRTASQEEIADVAWLPVDAARDRLSRPGDWPPLEELLSLHRRGRLQTNPLLVVRHAKAVSRNSWPGDEAGRPLTATGDHQAQVLAELLSTWRPARLLCSPWARCMQTIAPYVELLQGQGDRVEPEVLPLLSEQGLRDDPRRISAIVADLIDGGRGALVCTHRPVLAAVVDTLVAASPAAVRDDLPNADPWLSPAEVLVAHVAADRHGERPISAVERHLARSLRNRERRPDTRWSS